MDCGRPEFIRRTFELVTIHTQRLEAAGRGENVVLTGVNPFSSPNLQKKNHVYEQRVMDVENYLFQGCVRMLVQHCSLLCGSEFLLTCML